MGFLPGQEGPVLKEWIAPKLEGKPISTQRGLLVPLGGFKLEWQGMETREGGQQVEESMGKAEVMANKSERKDIAGKCS